RCPARGTDSGAQPLTSEDGSILLTVNGEIYNYRELAGQLARPHKFKTRSDCEYQEIGADVVGKLDGMFSFVLLDMNDKGRFIAARDPIGITTLYQGTSSKYPGAVFFASELKALNEVCDRIWSFPPGHFFDSASGETRRYYFPEWLDSKKVPTKKADHRELRLALEAAVRKRLMAEVPYGVLLSGGLDSSLIASIAAREIAKSGGVAKSGVNGHMPAENGTANG
ncbi:MAG: nucleophile aminohydrolase, partial [Olpidium bornovanus]